MRPRICENCRFWQPNGGVLKMGYCVANKWTYRKGWQSCEKFEEGTVFRFVFLLLDDTEGEIHSRVVRIKAASETEARIFFDKRFPHAWGVHVTAEL